jgi:Fe-S oxidoreductase
MFLTETILAESARLAAACTACGACVQACPMPDFLALPAADPAAVAAGMRAALDGEEPSAEGLAWVAACTRSGQCRDACPEALDVPFMLRLAGMRLKGALGEPARLPVAAVTGWAARVKAFARMTLTEEEQARWL